jgi:Kef-type K+ transport system membrane component KefB
MFSCYVVSAILFPFLCGALASFWLYDVNGNDNVDRLAFILFLGSAMSFTAFPVLASILQSSRLLANPLGVLTISCAAIDDVTAWCVLAIASSFARSSDPVQGNTQYKQRFHFLSCSCAIPQ